MYMCTALVCACVCFEVCIGTKENNFKNEVGVPIDTDLAREEETMHTMPQSKTRLRNCGKRDLANQLITHIYFSCIHIYQIVS